MQGTGGMAARVVGGLIGLFLFVSSSFVIFDFLPGMVYLWKRMALELQCWQLCFSVLDFLLRSVLSVSLFIEIFIRDDRLWLGYDWARVLRRMHRLDRYLCLLQGQISSPCRPWNLN